jgi:S1-C subfamily serine protease
MGLNLGRMSERGVAVGNLASSSVMYRAGLREGDYIVSINGHRLAGPGDFDRWVFAGGRHERVKCIVWRDGREEVIYLEPTILYVEETAGEERPHFGIVFDDRYPDRIVIRSVYPDSPAFTAGLQEGDEITTWSGQRVGSPGDFTRIIQRVEPGTVNFEYLRDSKRERGEARFSRR